MGNKLSLWFVFWRLPQYFSTDQDNWKMLIKFWSDTMTDFIDVIFKSAKHANPEIFTQVLLTSEYHTINLGPAGGIARTIHSG